MTGDVAGGSTGARDRRPYVDRPVTDLEGARRAAREAAEHWDLPEPTLLRRGMNAIFATDDHVLRVGMPTVPATASIELAGVLAEWSIRIPRPARDDVAVHGPFSVTCWERVVSTGEPVDWVAVGAMVGAVHRLDPAELPDIYPAPSPVTFPWWDFEAMLDDVGDDIDDRARAGLDATIERHRGWHRFEERVPCHGDVHPGNVLMAADGPVLLDWDLLCIAAPGWDHAPLMTISERWGGIEGLYEAFATGYGHSFRGDPEVEGYAELRLVAATLLRLRAARHDPGARDEAERRLAYWRGDPDAPTWSAQ